MGPNSLKKLEKKKTRIRGLVKQERQKFERAKNAIRIKRPDLSVVT